MSDEVDVRISPSLHPLNVREVDGYSEETAPVLGATESAFRNAYEACRAVHDARTVAKGNAAWTEGQVVIQCDNLARKYQERVTRSFDNARGDLMRGIEHLERDLSAPVTSKASLGIAAEIRSHCKSLPTDERMSFVRSLIVSGDELSASAVLGAPAFLSGLKAEMAETFTRMFHEHSNPAMTNRLRAMKGAVALIERNAPLIFRELEKAVGAPASKTKALREANTAAEKAMVMRDVI